MAEPKYANMSWDDLLQLRGALSPEYQAQIAPYEHRAWAREWTADNPLRAAAFMPLAIPGYQLGKLTGILSDDDPRSTPASWEQFRQAFKGFGEGMPTMGIGSQLMGALGRKY